MEDSTVFCFKTTPKNLLLAVSPYIPSQNSLFQPPLHLIFSFQLPLLPISIYSIFFSYGDLSVLSSLLLYIYHVQTKRLYLNYYWLKRQYSHIRQYIRY